MSIFISYSHQDVILIDAIRSDLPPWMQKILWLDREKLGVMEDVDRSIYETIISQSHFMIVFASKKSLMSEWVRKEIDIGRSIERKQNRNFIIVVSLDDFRSWDKNIYQAQIEQKIFIDHFRNSAADALYTSKELQRRLFETYVSQFGNLKDAYYDQINNPRVKVYLSRSNLPPLADIIKGASTFDLIALSARVLKDNWPVIVEQARAGLKIRVALYSPYEDNKLHYSALENVLGEMDVKAVELRNILRDAVNANHQLDDPHSIRIALISKVPLLYNMWIKDARKESQIGNLSVYFYNDMTNTPIFRSTEYSGDFVAVLIKEFEHVWTKSEEQDLSWTN